MSMSRRQFLKTTGRLGAAAAAMGVAGPGAAAEKAPLAMPTIQLGNLKVSRLILGSNPFFGYAHKGGGVGKAMRAYFTDERIAATLDEAAAWGVTAVAAPPLERWIALWKAYRAGGGKLRHWLAQPDRKAETMKEEIAKAVEGGASAVFVQGLRADEQFRAGDFDRLGRWVEHIRGLGVPAGLASHRPDTHPAYQARGLPLDFHFQCFYPDDHFRPEDRAKAVATIATLVKPVVGYKILAAGRLPAKDGFAFALEHLKPKDGMCVGVFPEGDPDQVEEDARLACG